MRIPMPSPNNTNYAGMYLTPPSMAFDSVYGASSGHGLVFDVPPSREVTWSAEKTRRYAVNAKKHFSPSDWDEFNHKVKDEYWKAMAGEPDDDDQAEDEPPDFPGKPKRPGVKAQDEAAMDEARQAVDEASFNRLYPGAARIGVDMMGVPVRPWRELRRSTSGSRDGIHPEALDLSDHACDWRDNGGLSATICESPSLNFSRIASPCKARSRWRRAGRKTVAARSPSRTWSPGRSLCLEWKHRIYCPSGWRISLCCEANFESLASPKEACPAMPHQAMPSPAQPRHARLRLALPRRAHLNFISLTALQADFSPDSSAMTSNVSIPKDTVSIPFSEFARALHASSISQSFPALFSKDISLQAAEARKMVPMMRMC
jgi:hypothetical protein